jgi:hypothetical protein
MIRKCAKLLIPVLPLLLFLNSIVFAAGKPDDTGSVANGVLVGQFKIDEKTPLADGLLFVYNSTAGPSSADKLLRVPDIITRLDREGRFHLELPPGTYYLSASTLPDMASKGPPAEGKLIYFRTNPRGEDEAFIVSAGKKTDAGVISSSAPFKRNPENHDFGQDKIVTTIEGIVVDADSKPVEGAIILAYVDPIQGKAFQVSERTVKDGKFALRLPKGGTYFLRVRSEYGGGSLKEGEIVSINDPSEVMTITPKNGEKLTGVTIRVKRLQRGPLYNSNSD